jgi:uncharacterized protein (DUF1499 family)
MIKGRNLMSLFGIFAMISVFAVLIYIRVAPFDATLWHKMPNNLAVGDRSNSAARHVAGGAKLFARLDDIARATPRTYVVAGSLSDGMITYVTRSLMMAFPDYTTIRQTDQGIEIYARARFGRSDGGVNAKRLQHWLAQLTP